MMPLLIAVVLILGIMLGFFFSKSGNSPLFIKYETESRFESGDLDEILSLVESRYYRNINIDSIRQKAIQDILSGLDPHSIYIDSEENKEISDQMNGQFDGIGIEFIIINDQICVLKVMPGGPADQAGVRPGDIILDVENDGGKRPLPIASILIKKMRGQRGTSANLLISRAGQNELLNVTANRDKIELPALGTSAMINDSIAYIQIKRFNSQTYRTFMEQIEQFAEVPSFKDIIIDVRGNSGGYLQEAVNILSQLFKEKGKLLVYTKGKSQKTTEYTSTGKAFFNIRKVAVIIDEQSASASEILAGTIQDLDRGIIVGSPSFGKGTVQEHFNLKSGGAVRLSIAKYYIPSGRSIQKFSTNDKYASLDTISIFKSSRGRTVKGNSGISPDIDIRVSKQIDFAQNEEIIRAVSEFAFLSLRKFSSENNLSLPSIKDPNSESFTNLFNELLQYLKEKDIENLAEEDLSRYFHNKLLYLLLDNRDYYDWLLIHDTALNTALKNLYNPNILLQEAVKN